MEKIPFSKFTTNNWSGGTTTELYIWPPTASFAKRNFDFRLSTATVEVETSVFTALPNVDRTLMVLEGEMSLTHEGQHSAHLKPFDTDKFNGGWTTHSKGKCIDLNLMCRGNTKGTLTPIELNHQDVITFNLKAAITLIYIYSGSIRLANSVTGVAGDLFVMDQGVDDGAVGLDNSNFVIIEVDGIG